jgi:tetratricopeptide (TPR) repeat protein
MLNNVANPNVPSSDNLHRELQQVQESLDSDPATAARLAGEIIGRYSGAPAPYRLLGTALRRLGRNEEAERADSEAISISARSPGLIEAAQAILSRQIGRAEHLIRSRLESDPEDAEALRLLADIAATAGRHQDAERLLRRAIEIAPAFIAAYVNLATLLQNLRRSDEAIALLNAVSAGEPRHHWALSLKAALLVAERRMNEAIQAH